MRQEHSCLSETDNGARRAASSTGAPVVRQWRAPLRCPPCGAPHQRPAPAASPWPCAAGTPTLAAFPRTDACRMSLSSSARQRVLFLILCFVWGTTWIAMKVGASAVPPGVFAGTRWTVAGLALIAFQLARGETVTVRTNAIGRTVVISPAHDIAESGDRTLQPAAHHRGPRGRADIGTHTDRAARIQRDIRTGNLQPAPSRSDRAWRRRNPGAVWPFGAEQRTRHAGTAGRLRRRVSARYATRPAP